MTLEYWTAREAAAHLGVSLPTLYAYVSRRRINSVPMPSSREHRYLRSDVEALRRPGRRDAREMGAAPGESAITLISTDGPIYRGRPAVVLAETETLETVAAHLWGVEPGVFDCAPLRGGRPAARLAASLRHEPAAWRAMAMMPFLEAASPRAFDLSTLGMARTGVDVVRWLAAIILGQARARTEPVHEQFARMLDLQPALSGLLRRLLVLAADHGAEQATCAVRAVAATGVTPWRSVAAGIAVVTGRSSKFGRNDALRRFLSEIMDGPDPERPVVARVRDNEDIPGFASDIYPGGDPRADALLGYCRDALADDPAFRRLARAVAVAAELRGVRPNFALVSMFTDARIGLPARGIPASVSSTEAPFLVGRAAGWIAHCIEQYTAGEAVRRHIPYKGKLPPPA